MKYLVLTIILSVTIKLGFAIVLNAAAYKFGQILGMLITLGLIVLIIWLIIKAVKKIKNE